MLRDGLLRRGCQTSSPGSSLLPVWLKPAAKPHLRYSFRQHLNFFFPWSGVVLFNTSSRTPYVISSLETSWKCGCLALLHCFWSGLSFAACSSCGGSYLPMQLQWDGAVGEEWSWPAGAWPGPAVPQSAVPAVPQCQEPPRVCWITLGGGLPKWVCFFACPGAM